MKIINNHSSLIDIKCSSLLLFLSIRFLQPSTVYCLPLSIDPRSIRPQRPIMLCPFSISLIAINTHQTLITFYKQVTYVPIKPFTNVKNVRQIHPYYAKQSQS